MKDWMRQLAAHYKEMKNRYPDDKLLFLFDIDGTILDMRCMILHLLQAYDHMYHTAFFQALTLSDITVSENDLHPLLAQLQIPEADQQKILTWYEAQAWSPNAILEAHRPFGGVLEVIRWFQLQPNTFVGLNTGRPEMIRGDTLNSLNKLGLEYKVNFSDQLLYMRLDNEAHITAGKVAGVKQFQNAGYRIVAFIDNEPDNLEAIAHLDTGREILLLHADTIFQSKRTKLPAHTIGGNIYTLVELINEEALPQHVQFVWRGIHEVTNLAQFLASQVHWGEFEVQLDPAGTTLSIPFSSLGYPSWQHYRGGLALDYLLTRLHQRKKGIKLDLKMGGSALEEILNLIAVHGIPDKYLWFSGEVEQLQEAGFKRLATGHPGAVIQCPINFLTPLICDAPAKAKGILDLLQGWGINRFAISWSTPNLKQFYDQMETWGFEVNIYDIPDLEAFLKAVLLMPHSITSDFNFPQWSYYGKGSGLEKPSLEYTLPQVLNSLVETSY